MQIDDNPAHDPTRPWSSETPAHEVLLYLRSIRGSTLRTLVFFCDHQGSPASLADASATLDEDPDAVKSDVIRANKFSESHGHVPVFQESKDGYMVEQSMARVFLSAIEESKSQHGNPS